MIFYYPLYLSLLVMLAIMLYAEYKMTTNKKKLRESIFSSGTEPLMFKNFNRKNITIKKVLFFFGLFFLIIALATPQWGKKEQALNNGGIDIVIAIDVSKSMLAKDLSPSRIDNAKESLSLLIDQLKGNRIGLVAFAGSSFIECPLTPDIGSVNLFLDSISPSLIPVPGTDIGGAIRTSVRAFGKTKNSKALVIITDGEDLSNNARGAANEAAQQGIRIYPIGIGTEAGETVPQIDENWQITGVKKDKNGQVVISRLDKALLIDIAKNTQGTASFVDSGYSTLPQLISVISSLPKAQIRHVINTQYEDRFPIFLFLSFLCLLIEIIIPERKRND